MEPTDTSAAAEARQRAAFAAMTPEQRLLAAMAMADEVKELTLTGIRMRHPDYDDEDVHREWLTILHGPNLAEKLLRQAAG